METKKFIDIRNVIAKKNPKLIKVFPRFILEYFRKILHEDEVNKIISLYQDKYGVEFVNNTINYMGFNYDVIGKSNIPESGRYIFIANHPLGGFDGLVLINEVGKHLGKLKFIVNDLLMNIPNLEPVFIPVNKHGRQSIEYVRKIEEAYASDIQILNFPAGLCSRKIKGKITDLVWKKNFVEKAVKHKRDIIPVYIEGKNSNFFYNLSNFRKKLGIKANIEMFYLVHEMFKQKNKHIALYFGKPIPYNTFDKKRKTIEWTRLLRKHVYELPINVNKEFLGS